MFTTVIKMQPPFTFRLQGLLAAITLLMPVAVWSEELPWDLQQQEGSINIYSRPVAGSSYLAIKATVLIDAPISRVSQFVGNGNGCAKWRSKCKSSRVIETVSKQERYVYAVLDLPWPVSDRDIVLHSKTDIDPHSKTATVSLQSDSSRHPPTDHVRAETIGQFVIRAVNASQVEFTYIMHTDLGGNLPANMVNSGVAEGAFEDVSRLQQLAEG